MSRHAVTASFIALAFSMACSGTEYTSGVAGGAGGQPADAGTSAVGASAGTVASGGVEPGSGGDSVAGGVGTAGEGSGGLGTGGDGSGGEQSSGGGEATGGGPASGGALGFGGAPAAGGAPGSGGGPAAGGAPGAGGAGIGGASSGGSAGTGVGGSPTGGSAGIAGQPAGGAAGTPAGGGGVGGVDCDCTVGAYIPVCGVDGVTYDAACGRVCVPVEIDCDGMCPCAGAGGSGGQGTDCVTECARSGLSCCDDRCVNLQNDPLNCGDCAEECPENLPYCGNGTCSEAPCSADTCSEGQTCCGTSCCTGSQICCLIIHNFNSTECVDPVDGTCPVGCPLCVCADPDTPVSTPEGQRRIADLRVGDLVYTVDQNGVTVAPIVQTRQTPVRDHHVVRVELAGGTVLQISGPHPTLDGRSFADLAIGDLLDGVTIAKVERVAYEHSFTYDILPASDTGAYFAGGVAIGSTLLQAP